MEVAAPANGQPEGSAVTKGAALSSSRAAAGASVTSATCKPEFMRNIKPTKPAGQPECQCGSTSNLGCGPGAVYRRQTILRLITGKCTMTFTKRRDKSQSLRIDRRIEPSQFSKIRFLIPKVGR